MGLLKGEDEIIDEGDSLMIYIMWMQYFAETDKHSKNIHNNLINNDNGIT